MQTIKLLIFSFVFVFAPAFCIGQQKTFLWKVTTPFDPLYLLGSIHVGNQSLYPLPASIEKAFRVSDRIAVEVNMTTIEGEGAYAFADAALYPRGDSLQKHINKETYNLIMKEFERYGVDSYRMQRLKPWALALMISGLESKKARVASEYGIDLHFINRATFLKKEILELETVELQASIFKDLTDKQQEMFLIDTIKNLSNEAANMTRLITAWREGDTKALEEYVEKTDQPQYVNLRERILTARNKAMVTKIEELIREPSTELVIVGAAHLVGKDGIVELLRKKAYSVEQQ